MSNQPLSIEECQRARMARDQRFDGRFYVAVKTTGIFCRPICPANLPQEKNVTYYFDQAQALQAGFRPCLRCRPDSAPSSWAWKGAETSFQRAIKLIEQGALQSGGISDLSDRLGISDRYLRKLFDKYLGMSPKQYAQYHKLMFAKQLLHESSITISDIAFASGFNSVRRFNDAFKSLLKLTPTQVRKSEGDASKTNHVRLGFKSPLHWQHMLNFYRMRSIEGVETIGDDFYERHFSLNGSKGWFRASVISNQHMQVEFELDDITQLKALVVKLRRMFDLDVSISEVEHHLTAIAPDLIRESGIRIPGVWSPWEAGVRAILGQQVSVKAAIGQLNLLTEKLNSTDKSKDSSGIQYFPTPEQVASADLTFLRMPNSRKETLARFADYCLNNPDADPSEWIEIKGVGPWTINYAQLRGQSIANCFLSGDLIVKKAMVHYPEMSPENVAPWGSYATLHCWNLPL
ncbi:DNA-3-methyladenine glycosylase 2 family protein [Vibrio penaeicida]|uniref:3-methyladenine DNA glycosylase n=1 Tax=Vibrio penaeicida TaxID=104609 RepID=A0AAV5NP25_9VIBR|nr:AlkA N-terminal domain-containing protein [Vibrio penaeicida]RTZ20770.1 DNA-3-methyladenine glycosylase 2 family protein [Vibrio penaeicida]GLQ72354.1 3-methyladenine DNA glycosylase [Vibrio penaeicida]